ncbi:hypothetical protein E4T42_07733 [Aureobasidium subglaciale]|nr:hypothetical protein E4T42_07733 [Aureobasidium subglaciale]
MTPTVQPEKPELSTSPIPAMMMRPALVVGCRFSPSAVTERATKEIALETTLVALPMQQARLPHIEGTRLWLLISVLVCQQRVNKVLCLALLMSALEQLIIGPALITISEDLGRYDLSSWVVNAYLLSYNEILLLTLLGFLVVFARCSDIFGRRSSFMTALIVFLVSSTACGAAQTMLQLIVFRAFQGVGGAGLFTLTASTNAALTFGSALTAPY